MQLHFFLKRYHALLALLSIGFALPTFAMSDDLLLKHAREAYSTQNEIALAQDVTDLKLQEHVLAPYAEYWLMLLRLSQAEPAEVEAFLTRHAEMSFADKLRGEWLKKLGKEQNWPLFFSQYAQYKRDETMVTCYALYGKLTSPEFDDALKQAAMKQGKQLWFTSQDLPSTCNALFSQLQNTGVITKADVWARVRLALQDNKPNVAKALLLKLPYVPNNAASFIDKAAQSPQLVLTKKTFSWDTDLGAELNLYALDRMARAQLEDAIALYEKSQTQFSEAPRAFGWGRIALHAARAHHPNAIQFYQLAGNSFYNDNEQLAWYARAGLRAGDWQTVLQAINHMQPDQAKEGAWRYWKARALYAKNDQVAAIGLFAELAKERHFYGWLAAEEIETISSPLLPDPKVTEVEVTAIASEPAIKGAIALNQLDMRWEAKAEWVWATRNFSDKQLLAAAEYAMRNSWYDVAIATADNTKSAHNFDLRYPAPYRDLMHKAATEQQVDEAWMHGLIRQESRFMHFAKSSVGAAGLMQIMPATAKWAAQRMGMVDYSPALIHDLNTNVYIGTYYMRHTLDLMGGQAVMATAAYNAGPSRAKRWQANVPLEAAIYMETIPFSETRSYVQKVMANAHVYAPRLGVPVQSLKARLGTIPAKITVDK